MALLYLDQVFHKRLDPNMFSAVIVPDLTLPNACNEVMKGCTGVVHIAMKYGYAARLDGHFYDRRESQEPTWFS